MIPACTYPVRTSFMKAKIKYLLPLLAVLLMLPLAVAQDAAPAAAAAPAAQEMSGFDKFQYDAGYIGWVIELLSVIGLTLIIKLFIEIRKVKMAPPEIVDEIEALLEADEFQEAMEVCESEPCFFTNVVAAGLPKINVSFDTMEKHLEEMMDEEVTRVNAKLAWLSLIAAIAPMLGLLGTVQGMIAAFDQIAATKGQATPDQLAHNIASALITTLLGLMVAIPVTSAYVILRNRMVSFTIEVGSVIQDMFERFRPRNAS